MTLSTSLKSFAFVFCYLLQVHLYLLSLVCLYPYKSTVLFVGHRQTVRERSGSVVECLTRDRRAAGSSLTGVTALCP